MRKIKYSADKKYTMHVKSMYTPEEIQPTTRSLFGTAMTLMSRILVGVVGRLLGSARAENVNPESTTE